MQAVQQVVRVERDLQVGARERALDLLERLGVVARACVDRQLAGRETQAYRGVAVGDQSHPLEESPQ